MGVIRKTGKQEVLRSFFFCLPVFLIPVFVLGSLQTVRLLRKLESI